MNDEYGDYQLPRQQKLPYAFPSDGDHERKVLMLLAHMILLCPRRNSPVVSLSLFLSTFSFISESNGPDISARTYGIRPLPLLKRWWIE